MRLHRGMCTGPAASLRFSVATPHLLRAHVGSFFFFLSFILAHVALIFALSLKQGPYRLRRRLTAAAFPAERTNPPLLCGHTRAPVLFIPACVQGRRCLFQGDFVIVDVCLFSVQAGLQIFTYLCDIFV